MTPVHFSTLGLTLVHRFTRSPGRLSSPGLWPVHSHTSPFHPKSGLKRHLTTSPQQQWPTAFPSTSVSSPLSPHFLPNRSIIRSLSLVNVAGHSADAAFICVAGVSVEPVVGQGVGQELEEALCGPGTSEHRHKEGNPFEVQSVGTVGKGNFCFPQLRAVLWYKSVLKHCKITIDMQFLSPRTLLWDTVPFHFHQPIQKCSLSTIVKASINLVSH